MDERKFDFAVAVCTVVRIPSRLFIGKINGKTFDMGHHLSPTRQGVYFYSGTLRILHIC